MINKVHIKEIFESIQGEGPYIGYKQLFIRFCGCNLSCKYCDTDFSIENSKEYSVNKLLDIVRASKDCHSVSLTGGEPLLHLEFLKEFLPQCPLPVYLETNATIYENLDEIIDYIDYVSADIKLNSCSNNGLLYDKQDKFFEKVQHKVVFAKIVFDENITEAEIDQTCALAAKYRIEIILQPKMDGQNLMLKKDFIEDVFNKYVEKYQKVRLIPQVHKFLNVR